jgi:hypothetical protein
MLMGLDFRRKNGRERTICPVNTTKVGTMSLNFTDCSNAQLSYSLPADPAEGDIAITRVIPGGQALCEELAGVE